MLFCSISVLLTLVYKAFNFGILYRNIMVGNIFKIRLTIAIGTPITRAYLRGNKKIPKKPTT